MSLARGQHQPDGAALERQAPRADRKRLQLELQAPRSAAVTVTPVPDALREECLAAVQSLDGRALDDTLIDPDEVRKLAEEKRKLEEAQQLKAGEVEKVVEARVRSVKGELDKNLAGVTAERDALSARLTAIQIDQAVVSEATKRGLRATAIPDITSRRETLFAW